MGRLALCLVRNETKQCAIKPTNEHCKKYDSIKWWQYHRLEWTNLQFIRNLKAVLFHKKKELNAPCFIL